MLFAYDLEAGALYVTLSDASASHTAAVDDSTNVDLDEDGALVGIEVLDLDRPWPLEQILANYEVPAAVAALLSAAWSAGWRAPVVTVSSAFA